MRLERGLHSAFLLVEAAGKQEGRGKEENNKMIMILILPPRGYTILGWFQNLFWSTLLALILPPQLP